MLKRRVHVTKVCVSDIAALRKRYECAWYAEGGCLGPVTGSLDLKSTLCSVLCGQISGSVARGCFLFARVLPFR